VGLTQDLYSPAVLGQNALAKTIIGACIGLFNEKVMRTDAMGKTVVLFVMFFVHDIIFMLVLVAKNSAGLSVVLLGLLTKTLPRALYSGIIAVMFYAWDFLPRPAGRR
jgi:rod shape-determining protein MreD